MSLTTFFTLSAIGWFVGAVVVIGGVGYYLYRRGVFSKFRDAAKEAVNEDLDSFKDRIG